MTTLRNLIKKVSNIESEEFLDKAELSLLKFLCFSLLSLIMAFMLIYLTFYFFSAIVVFGKILSALEEFFKIF